MKAETQYSNGALEDAALDLAAQEATGRLLVGGTEGQYGWLWLRDGLLSGASGPGPRPLIANRIATFELLPQSQIGKLISETRSRPGARMIEVLIEREVVPLEFISEFVALAAAEQISHLEAMPVSQVRFEPGVVHAAGPSELTVENALTHCRSLRTELSGIAADARFATRTSSSGLSQPVARSLASFCDGSRNLAQIAYVSGLTRHEAIVWLEGMLAAGQIEVTRAEEPVTDWENQTPIPQPSEAAAPEPAAEPADQTAAAPTHQAHPSGPPPAPAAGNPVVAPEATTPSHLQPPEAASDRRHLLSTLAALSAEADTRKPATGHSPTGGPGEPESTESTDQAEADSTQDSAIPEDADTTFAAATPTGSRGIASEMFRELHSLGEE